MATNFYFSNFFNSGEQNLMHDLIVEAIRIYGIDVLYLPRTVVYRNPIMRDAEIVEFNDAIEVEVYIRDVNGFTGDAKFLSKFGLEIRDEITFTFAQRTFMQEVGTQLDIIRPREGDLIFLPLNQKVFQIKFVDQESIFYQLGDLQIFDCVCEVFEYSDEQFNTGYQLLDDRYNVYSTAIEDYEILTEDGYALSDEDGNPLVDDSYDVDSIVSDSQNDEIQNESDEILDWAEHDPFAEGDKI